jgi:AcrR family transcriptional regulator
MSSSVAINPKPEPYHHGNLRQALLESALELVEQDGIDALSLREVARQANVSPAAPYHHFKDKATILGELAKIGLERLAQNSQQAIVGIQNPLEKLNQIGVAYVLYAFEHPNLFKLMFNSEPAENPSQTLDDPAQAVLLEILRECVNVGCIPIKDEASLRIAAIRSWALVHGLATLIVSGPLGHSIKTRAQVIELTQQITGSPIFDTNAEAITPKAKPRAKK